MGRLPLLLLVAVALLAGCGGGSDAKDPAAQVPAEGGVRAKVRAAQAVTAADFPATDGPHAAAGGRRRRDGRARARDGELDLHGRQEPRSRSGSSTTARASSTARPPSTSPRAPTSRPRARSRRPPTCSSPRAATAPSRRRPRPTRSRRSTPRRSRSRAGQLLDPRRHADRRQDLRRPRPDQGDRHARTTASPASATARRRWRRTRSARAGGDVASIDTRVPPSDMHAKSFADVVGKKPVALLFATPQLCQSRVCGPVVDVALQMKAKYGDRVEFIHQEVYEDNDLNEGPARAAAALQPAHGAVAVRGRQATAGSPRGWRGPSGSPPSRRRSRPHCDHRLRARARAALAACRSRSGCSGGRRRSCSASRSSRWRRCGRSRGSRTRAGGRCRAGRARARQPRRRGRRAA